jgi:hypothetical protein
VVSLAVERDLEVLRRASGKAFCRFEGTCQAFIANGTGICQPPNTGSESPLHESVGTKATTRGEHISKQYFLILKLKSRKSMFRLFKSNVPFLGSNSRVSMLRDNVGAVDVIEGVVNIKLVRVLWACGYYARAGLT